MFENLIRGFRDTFRAPILHKLREIESYRQWSGLPRNRLIDIHDYLDSKSIQQIHSSQVVKLKRPLNEGALHPVFDELTEFDSPATFVARLRDCRFFGRGIAVITPDGTIISDVTVHLGGTIKDHTVMRLFKFPTLERLQGTTVILSAPSGAEYYHWLFDVLPRIRILQLSDLQIENADHYVINSSKRSYQRDMLTILGVDQSRIVESDRARHFLCDDMILPSYPGTILYPAKWVCDFLAESFLPKEELQGLPDSRRLYINRRKAPRRRILNQDELDTFLIKHGFTVIDSADYSVPAQAQLFNRAEVVIGPHGAGLSNLTFCRPKTTIIELFPPSTMPLCYWILSNHMGLNYYYHLGIEPRGENRRTDFTIDLRKLENLFSEAGI